MPYTAEQRRANLAKGRATQAAKKAAHAVADPPDPDTDSDDLLTQLGQALLGASKKKADSGKVLRQLEDILGQLDPKEHPELLSDPTIQAFIDRLADQRAQAAEHQDDPPGTVYGNGLAVTAKPWTWRHVEFLHQQDPEGMFKKKTIIPSRTEQIIINQLGVWFPEGQEITFYAPWVDQYIAGLAAGRSVERHRQWLMKVGPWAPGIPVELQPKPEADWLEDSNGVSTRAAGAGMYLPGSGWNPAVDGRHAMPAAAEGAPNGEAAAE